MAMTDALLPEFDHEMGTTRKLLERAPEGEFGWKPHDKSMTLGQLSQHVADIPGWVGVIINQSSFDVDAGGEGAGRTATSRSALLAEFEKNIAAARGNIASKSDAELMAPWTLLKSGKQMMTLPKVAVLRSFLLNHLIHHRGQLSVYLRIKNVPIPSIYGPSADEPM